MAGMYIQRPSVLRTPPRFMPGNTGRELKVLRSQDETSLSSTNISKVEVNSNKLPTIYHECPIIDNNVAYLLPPIVKMS